MTRKVGNNLILRFLPGIAVLIVAAGLWTSVIDLVFRASDERFEREIRAEIEQPISWELRCGNHYQNGLQVCEMIRHGWQPIVAWDVEKWPVKQLQLKEFQQ